jgi:hypothetical protein
MSKKVKKSRTQKLAKAIGELAVSAEGQHRKALRKSMKAAMKNGDMQTARSLSYQLAREEGAAVHKEASAQLASVGTSGQVQSRAILNASAQSSVGTSNQLQPRAILNASAQTIRNAQRSVDRGAGLSQRETLRGVYRGDYVAQAPDVDASQLESQSRVQEAERALRKARTPEAREAAAYQLTRWKLIDGHRKGEI